MKEPRAMREVHEIRLKMYRKWKKMSREEIMKSIEEGSKKVDEEIKMIRKKKKISV